MNVKRIIFYLFIPMIFASCSDGLENLGSMSFTKVSSDTIPAHYQETTLDLNKGDVIELWNSMSIETKQKNEIQMHYEFEHFFDGKSLESMQINALKTNPTIDEFKEMARGRMLWSFQGKMKSIEIQEPGKHTFKAAIFTSDEFLLLNRAKLIVKRRTT